MKSLQTEKSSIIQTDNYFVELVRKNIRIQYNELDFYMNLPYEVRERALKLAEKAGWLGGKPQVISQVLIYLAAKESKIDIEWIVFNDLFRISKKSWTKWNAILEMKGL